MRRSMRLAVGLGILLVGASVPDAVASTGAVTAAPPVRTVTVDLSHRIGAFPFRPGGQLGATPNSWRYGAETYASMERLRLERTRIWLRFTDTVDRITGIANYPRWYDYVDTYHSRAASVLVNWRSDYDPLVTGGSWNAERLFAAERDMLAHYKARFPKVEYIEVENEDLAKPEQAPAYYAKYRLMYRVVNAVNAMGLPGVRLKVGGPTLDVFSEGRLKAFLDQFQRDTDPAKRLDFVSYHQYLINTTNVGDWTAQKDNPAIVAKEKATVDALLKAIGRAPVPVLVSEVGVFPGTRESPLGFEADLHIQAAALASLHYHYAGQPGIVPIDWTIDHPENDRKDLFLDTATGEPRPYYNVLRMESMLPPTRYQAASDTLTARGIGIYGMAGADAGTIAVMTWNYQWTNQVTHQSRVVVVNFPAAFRTSNVRVTRYRIAGDVHSGALVPVETFVIGPRTGGYVGQTLPLGPNELRLTVLTPTTDPVGRAG